MRERVAVGVELLEKQEGPVPLPEAVDRLESVTSDPTRIRTILDEAEKRGVVERTDGVLRSTSGAHVSYESEVVVREGDFDCERCGAGLTAGHFVQFDAGELGPFGPECVRKVTGRD